MGLSAGAAVSFPQILSALPMTATASFARNYLHNERARFAARLADRFDQKHKCSRVPVMICDQVLVVIGGVARTTSVIRNLYGAPHSLLVDILEQRT